MKRYLPILKEALRYLDNLMVVVCDFRNGPMQNPDPPHSHPHEQITYVADGELIFFKEKEKYSLKPGDLITVPAGVGVTLFKLLVTMSDLLTALLLSRKDFLKPD